jgi:hypothetical protein
MSSRLKAITASAYILFLVGLGITDATFTSGLTIYPRNAYQVTKVETGIARKQEPDVFAILQTLNIETAVTKKEAMLSRIVPSQLPLTIRVLLQNDEGLGLFAYTESPDVRAFFTALKDALHQSFSKDVRDVVDVVEAPEGRPVRNVLSFVDPSLSSDKIILLRVRSRLYEFHVPEAKEPVIRALIELTE